MRDVLIYWGGREFVLIKDDQIYFDISRIYVEKAKTYWQFNGISFKKGIDPMLLHDNMINFRLFAAYYYVELIKFLESLAPFIYDKFNVQIELFPQQYFTNSTIKDWIEKLLEAIVASKNK